MRRVPDRVLVEPLNYKFVITAPTEASETLQASRRFVSRETLARDVWREPARTSLLCNIIDVHIGRLRRKIDFDYPIKLIHTVRGVGFMLATRSPDQRDDP